MNTITAETIKSGEKVNSMYQPNSVYCKASKEEMERFYEDSEDLSPRGVYRHPNAMRKYSVEGAERNRTCSLIIEV